MNDDHKPSDQAFSYAFQHTYVKESCALYAFGILVIALRLYCRIRNLRGLDVDDYLMITAAGWYTALIVCLNLTARGGGSALAMPGEDLAALAARQIKERVKGAKIDLVAEQAMLNVIWTLKTCMLLLYNRLTMGLRQQMAVKIIAAYVAIGYVACQLAFFCQCIPFHSYWQIVPSPSLNCMVLYDYAIVQGTFNISSDIFMLMVPLPLIITVSVPVKQKLVLLVIFSMGIFVIVAATLTKAEFFINIYSDDYMFWYTREASVAVYIANLPCIWPLLRELLPVLKSWTPGFISSSHYRRRRGTSTGPMTRGATTRTNVTRRSLDEFQKIVDTSTMAKSEADSQIAIHELREYDHRNTIQGGGDTGSDSDCDTPPTHGIRAETTIEMRVMTPGKGEARPESQEQDQVLQNSPARDHSWDLERGARQSTV